LAQELNTLAGKIPPVMGEGKET